MGDRISLSIAMFAKLAAPRVASVATSRALQTRIPAASTPVLNLATQRRHSSNAPAPVATTFESDALNENYDKYPAVPSHMLFSEELVSSTHQPPALSQSSLLLP